MENLLVEKHGRYITIIPKNQMFEWIRNCVAPIGPRVDTIGNFSEDTTAERLLRDAALRGLTFTPTDETKESYKLPRR